MRSAKELADGNRIDLTFHPVTEIDGLLAEDGVYGGDFPGNMMTFLSVKPSLTQINSFMTLSCQADDQ
jgi:hypothetical protein